ncbi:3705_t:CDS:2, partial [Cetraspora pellucida]
MANSIMSVLYEFDLATKTLALTTDNASSMILCTVMKGIELVDMSIEKIRSLMNYLKSFQPTNEALKCLCKAKNIKYLTPELDVKTRWDSVYYMLEKWKKLESVSKMLSIDNLVVGQHYPTKEDCIKINDTMLLLEPFERATCYLSASRYPTYGAVHFVFLGIQEHLLRYSNMEEFTQSIMARTIYKKLNKYWLIMDEASQISSLLDPGIKLSAFSSEIEKNQVKQKILNLSEYTLNSSQLIVNTAANDLVDARNYFRSLQSNNTIVSSISLLNLPTTSNSTY